jgi:hypothetical protein
MREQGFAGPAKCLLPAGFGPAVCSFGRAPISKNAFDQFPVKQGITGNNGRLRILHRIQDKSFRLRGIGRHLDSIPTAEADQGERNRTSKKVGTNVRLLARIFQDV